MNEKVEAVEVKVGEDLAAALNRIARELATQRSLLTDLVRFMRDAESEIPEYMRRFMNYMHDLQDIKYMYEDLGHQVPEHHKREAERCDDRFRQLLKRLHAEGEAFARVRQEMAADPDNRWDHTRQLEFKPTEKII